MTVNELIAALREITDLDPTVGDWAVHATTTDHSGRDTTLLVSAVDRHTCGRPFGRLTEPAPFVEIVT
jgi:hypothetical protein